MGNFRNFFGPQCFPECNGDENPEDRKIFPGPGLKKKFMTGKIRCRF
jgi:hypothetical protein